MSSFTNVSNALVTRTLYLVVCAHVTLGLDITQLQLTLGVLRLKSHKNFVNVFFATHSSYPNRLGLLGTLGIFLVGNINSGRYGA